MRRLLAYFRERLRSPQVRRKLAVPQRPPPQPAHTFKPCRAARASLRHACLRPRVVVALACWQVVYELPPVFLQGLQDKVAVDAKTLKCARPLRC